MVTSFRIVSATARCLVVRFDRFEKAEQLDQVHLADFVKIAIVDGHQPPCSFQPRTAAFGAGVFDHDLFQVLVHSGVRRALLAIPAIMMLELIDDAVELDFLADMLLALLCSWRQDNLRTVRPSCRTATGRRVPGQGPGMVCPG